MGERSGTGACTGSTRWTGVRYLACSRRVEYMPYSACITVHLIHYKPALLDRCRLCGPCAQRLWTLWRCPVPLECRVPSIEALAARQQKHRQAGITGQTAQASSVPEQAIMGRKGRYGSKEKLHSVRRAGVCKPRLHRPGWTGGGGGGAARGFWTLTLPMDGMVGYGICKICTLVQYFPTVYSNYSQMSQALTCASLSDTAPDRA